MPFQVVGRFSWKLIGCAAGSRDAMVPLTLQNCGRAGANAPSLTVAAEADTSTAEVTEALPLGSPVAPGVMAWCARPAQEPASRSAFGAVPHADKANASSAKLTQENVRILK
ncbi:hypothetical protein [Variovorax sp. UC74_104]|uniref:hypothetical protein n=1 Tax=Variovorax sp. UC74_104 TaxID=3374555 RepID=UPI0037584708